MTTATKNLPDHGTYARANGCPGYREPCKCEICLPARRTAKKRERVNRQLGRHAHRDAAQAAARLAELNKVMGWEDIAKAVGSSASHLREIATGRIPRVKQTTYAKIMAIKPEPSGGQFIDATGSIRRVRALHTIGHTALVIAEAAGTNRSRILPLLDGHPRMRRSLAIRIEAAYEVLSTQPGSNARAINRAAREGWRDPQWWEDYGSIDDPGFNPDAADVLGFRERAALRREEITHLAAFGSSPEEIHQRLGEEVSISTVRQIVQEWRTGVKRVRTSPERSAA